MLRGIHKLWKLPAMFAVALLFVSAPVMAVDYNGIGGLPANPDPNNERTKSIYIYTLEPSQTKKDGLRVINNSDSPKTIEVYATDSEIASGGSFACKQKVDPKKEVGAWIKFEDNEVTLAPGTEKVIEFTIAAPAELGVGEHDGCVVIQEKKSTPDIKQGGVNISLRSALRVIVTRPGQISKDVDIQDIKVAKKTDLQTITVNLINKGNVSLDTELKVTAKTIFGNKVYENGGIYPVISRERPLELNYEMNDPFWGGIYKIQAVINYDSNPNTKVGENQHYNTENVSRIIYVFVMPKPAALTLYILLVAGAAAGVAQLRKRKAKQNEISNNWVSYTTKKNDTIQKLALATNVEWKTIANVNGLKPPYHLEPKTEIQLPPEINVKPKKTTKKTVKATNKTASSKRAKTTNSKK